MTNPSLWYVDITRRARSAFTTCPPFGVWRPGTGGIPRPYRIALPLGRDEAQAEVTFDHTGHGRPRSTLRACD